MRATNRISVYGTMILLAATISLPAEARYDGLVVGVAQEKLGVPFISAPFGDTLYPHLYASGAYEFRSSDAFRLYINPATRVGGKGRYSPVGTTASIGADVIPRFQHGSGLYLDGVVGLYYSRAYTRLAIYRTTDDGVSQVRDWGRSFISLRFGTGLGYDLSDRTPLPLRISVRANAEIMYAPSLHFAILNLLPVTSVMVVIEHVTGGTE